MAKSTCSNGATMVDMKIEQFCQSSSELLKSIHARCGNMSGTASAAKARKNQKTKAAKGVSITDLTLDHDETDLALEIDEADLALDIDETDVALNVDE